MKESVKLSFKNARLGFYQPEVDLTPPNLDPRFEAQSLDWSNEKSVSGELEIWGPAKPGDNSSLPEPRAVLFAGERGYVLVRIRNRGNAPLVVSSAGIQSGRAGPLKGGTRAKLAIAPRSTGVYTVPVGVSADAEATFAPLSLRISCSVEGRKVTLSHRTHLIVGRILDYDQKVTRSRGAGNSNIAMSLTVDMPGGIRETVSSKLRTSVRVNRSGVVKVAWTPLEYKCSTSASQAFAATAMIPQDLYSPFSSFDEIVRSIGKKVWCTATAAIMAALAVAGIAVTKALIVAAATVALGPISAAVVSVVILQPMIETWFTYALGSVGAATGWVLNEELFNELFPPD